MQQVEVYRSRTVILPVSLGFDVSEETITSEIRVAQSPTSDLIATWTVTNKTDGTDGEIILTLDDEITSEIVQTIGYMDLKRMSGGEPLSIFSEPLQVVFLDPVTA